jgi:hypothetical protein
MGLLSSIELPHWLIIGGAVFIATGFLGLAFTRNKEAATSELPVSSPRMQALPRLLDSSSRGGNR